MVRKHHMIMKKRGNRVHRYILNGNGLVNVDLLGDTETVPTVVIKQGAKKGKLPRIDKYEELENSSLREPEKPSKEAILSEIGKKFSNFTGETNKKRFRIS